MGGGYAADGSEIDHEVKLGKAGGVADVGSPSSVVGLETPADEDDMLDNELAEAQRQLELLKKRAGKEKGVKGGGGGFLPAI
jgi:hypothetical protein